MVKIASEDNINLAANPQSHCTYGYVMSARANTATNIVKILYKKSEVTILQVYISKTVVFSGERGKFYKVTLECWFRFFKQILMG